MTFEQFTDSLRTYGPEKTLQNYAGSFENLIDMLGLICDDSRVFDPNSNVNLDYSDGKARTEFTQYQFWLDTGDENNPNGIWVNLCMDEERINWGVVV